MTRRSTRPPLPVAVAATLLATMAALLVTVAPATAATFSNPSAITTTDPPCTPAQTAGPATLYPSPITVSGLSGTVGDVNVTFHGMNNWRGEFEILLVGPGGGSQNLVLLSDAGTGDVSNFTLTIDDEAGALLPQGGAWPSSGKPTDYPELGGETTFPSPAPATVNRPAPAGGATLSSVFDGINPNGTWNLYVVADACDDPVETITGGWSLDITVAAGASTTTAVTSSPNPSTTGGNVTFTATVTSGGNPVTTGTVTFSEGATTLATNVALNGSGQAMFSISTLPEGNHVITATYNPGTGFSTSNGSVSQRVNNATVVTGNTYCNTGPITINASPNVATPYPSNILVSGAPTGLTDVDVALKNVTHPFPDDIDVLLVGPAGQNLVLVSDAGNPGGSVPPNPPGANNVTVNFDDAAAGQLAQNTPWGAAGSTVSSKPIDYDPLAQVDAFPAPAPAPSAATALTTFNGTNPNGTWSLYVVSDGAPETGTIAGGWCLTLVSAQPDVTVTKTDSPDPVVAGANLTYAIGVSNAVSGTTAQNLILTDTVPANTTFVSLTPAAGWNCTLPAVGSAGGTVNCTRAALTPADGIQSFTLVVRVDTHAPAGAPVANSATLAASTPDANSVNNQAIATTAVTFARSLPAVVTGSINWALRDSLTTGPPTTTFVYGTKPLVPVMGDWDGDGTRTAGTFEAGTFRLNNQNDSSPPELTFTFGDSRGFPVVGDWNGDGLDDVAVFRSGTWETRLTGSGTIGSFPFGSGTWPATVPVAGDWDGDGTDGIGTYTLMGAGTGTWNLRQTASGGAPDAGTFVYNPGTSPYPVVGDWDGDGDDTVGVKTGTTPATWLLNNQNDSSGPEVTFDFGAASDFPLTWRQLSTP